MSKNAETKTITEKLADLDQQVEWFYGDDFALDKALSQYEKAKSLATEIESDLSKLKNKVELLEDFTKS